MRGWVWPVPRQGCCRVLAVPLPGPVSVCSALAAWRPRGRGNPAPEDEANTAIPGSLGLHPSSWHCGLLAGPQAVSRPLMGMGPAGQELLPFSVSVKGLPAARVSADPENVGSGEAMARRRTEWAA